MTTPNELRRTTSDQKHLKILRVKGALMTPDIASKSNREIARLLQVDEKMIRNWRAWAAKFVSQEPAAEPAPEPAKPAAKKNAGKKRKSPPKG